MENWRQRYIHILKNGPSEADYELAAELIDGGYAKGHVLPNHTGTGSKIANIKWSGITTSGRKYLGEIENELYRESWAYRAWSVGKVAAGFLLGLLTTYINSRI